MARRKAPAIEVPATLDEARELAAEFVAAERQILQARLVAEQVIDQVKSERDALIALVATPNASRFASLKAWWEAGGKEIAGRNRSAELAGAKIGIRLTPQKVKLPRGLKDAGVVEWLRTLRWTKVSRFLRTKVEFDKEALIKAHAAEEDVRRMFATKGIGVVQTDEFFIDAGLDPEALKKDLGG